MRPQSIPEAKWWGQPQCPGSSQHWEDFLAGGSWTKIPLELFLHKRCRMASTQLLLHTSPMCILVCFFKQFLEYCWVGKIISRNRVEIYLSQLLGKDPDAAKEWKPKEKRAAEDEMVKWHHWLNGQELEQTPGDSEGQGSLACCSPRVTKNQTWLSDWTAMISKEH